MSSYAFFVGANLLGREQEAPDASVSSSEFNKKCSEMKKTKSAKDKGKCEDMA